MTPDPSAQGAPDAVPGSAGISALSQPAVTHTEGKKYLQAFFKNDRLGKANCQKSS